MNMKIKQKLVIVLLLVSIIPALFISFFNISGVLGISEASGRDKVVAVAGLEVIASLKANSIATIFQSVKGYAEMFKGSAVVEENFSDLERFAGEPSNLDYQVAKRHIDDRFANWARGQKWVSDLMLTDMSGRIIYDFDPDRIEKKLGTSLLGSDKVAFDKGKEGGHVGSVFLHKHAEEAESFPEVFVYAPINDSHGAFIGEIVLAVKMDMVYTFIQDHVGMGETGEIILVEERDGEITLLNPLRFDDKAVLKKWSVSDPELPLTVKLAARGGGAGAFTDYRGRAVSGAWRSIPELRWGVLAKMDTAELLKELNSFRDINIFVLIIFVFISMAVAIYFANSILNPIIRLTHVLTEISKGKLDVTLEKVNTKDEVGELARAFERVIVSLKLAMRDLGKTKPESQTEKTKPEEMQKEVKTDES